MLNAGTRGDERSFSNGEAAMSDFTIREAAGDDWRDAGRICYEAFKTVSGEHGFPPDFPDVDAAALPLKWMIGHPNIYGAVAERDGRIIGSIFMDERSAVSAIGPITVEPGDQNSGVGKALMLAAMDHAAQRGALGVRLVQLAFHNRSLSLYAKLGFNVRDSYAAMYGPAIREKVSGYDIRPATVAELPACDELCIRVHGLARHAELAEAIEAGTARVVEHLGRITGYTTKVNYFFHSVADTNDSLIALICEAGDFGTPGFLVPLSNAELFRWALGRGLRVWFVAQLMTTGIYQEPAGAYMPSVGY
jgi:GNAT superfamily N-acetyltransferase